MLRNCRNDLLPDELGEEDFIEFSEGDSDKIIGLIFLCAGCKKPISIGSKGWVVDREHLSASPSIVCDTKKGGCGWHGHLVNGELKPV